MPNPDPHIDQINPDVDISTASVCIECEKTGDTWVKLRRCLVCGSVGCCDSSKNMHADKHFKETNHAVMQSAEPGEKWRWCYIDEDYLAEE